MFTCLFKVFFLIFSFVYEVKEYYLFIHNEKDVSKFLSLQEGCFKQLAKRRLEYDYFKSAYVWINQITGLFS